MKVFLSKKSHEFKLQVQGISSFVVNAGDNKLILIIENSKKGCWKAAILRVYTTNLKHKTATPMQAPPPQETDPELA